MCLNDYIFVTLLEMYLNLTWYSIKYLCCIKHIWRTTVTGKINILSITTFTNNVQYAVALMFCPDLFFAVLQT